MQLRTDTLARTVRRLLLVAVVLVIAESWIALAYRGGGGGMMGGGMLGGAMGLWGLLWVGLLVAVPAYLVYRLGSRGGRPAQDPLSVLRECYARGELSDEEFERRRARLEADG